MTQPPYDENHDPGSQPGGEPPRRRRRRRPPQTEPGTVRSGTEDSREADFASGADAKTDANAANPGEGNPEGGPASAGVEAVPAQSAAWLTSLSSATLERALLGGHLRAAPSGGYTRDSVEKLVDTLHAPGGPPEELRRDLGLDEEPPRETAGGETAGGETAGRAEGGRRSAPASTPASVGEGSSPSQSESFEDEPFFEEEAHLEGTPNAVGQRGERQGERRDEPYEAEDSAAAGPPWHTKARRMSVAKPVAAVAIAALLGAGVWGSTTLLSDERQPGTSAGGEQAAQSAPDSSAPEGSGSAADSRQPLQEAAGVAQPQEVSDSGVVYGELDTSGETATLPARTEDGERSWEGTITRRGSGQDGDSSSEGSGRRSVSLDEGPTQATFELELPAAMGTVDSGAMSGVFGDGAEEGTTFHATFHRSRGADAPSDSQSVPLTQGNYYIYDDDGVIAQGTYVDRRQDADSDEVTRTYTEEMASRAAGDNASGRESGRRTFAVSYEAPTRTPIPDLVGWSLPDGASPEVSEGGSSEE